MGAASAQFPRSSSQSCFQLDIISRFSHGQVCRATELQVLTSVPIQKVCKESVSSRSVRIWREFGGTKCGWACQVGVAKRKAVYSHLKVNSFSWSDLLEHWRRTFIGIYEKANMGEKANRLSCRYVSVGISAFITLVDMCHDNLYRFEPPIFNVVRWHVFNSYQLARLLQNNNASVRINAMKLVWLHPMGWS